MPLGSFEMVSLTNLAVPPAGIVRLLGLSCRTEGQEVRVADIAGPGTYTLSNGVVHLSTQFDGRWRLSSANPSKRQAPFGVEYSTSRAHLLLFPGQLPPAKVLRYRVKDELGAPVPILEWHDNSGSACALEFDTNQVKTVSVDLAVCPKFQFEFFVKPPSQVNEWDLSGPSSAPKLFRF